MDLIDAAAWKRLADKMSYVRGDLTKPAPARPWAERSRTLRRPTGRRATPSSTSRSPIGSSGWWSNSSARRNSLTRTRILTGKRRFWRRVVIEKPFGHSLASARALNHTVQRRLSEDQIFRIDHFLGKDTVQNSNYRRFVSPTVCSNRSGTATGLITSRLPRRSPWRAGPTVRYAWTAGGPIGPPRRIHGQGDPVGRTAFAAGLAKKKSGPEEPLFACRLKLSAYRMLPTAYCCGLAGAGAASAAGAAGGAASRSFMAARRERRTLPVRSSMPMHLTQIMSPILTTSSVRRTRKSASSEMCTRPSLPGMHSTKRRTP